MTRFSGFKNKGAAKEKGPRGAVLSFFVPISILPISDNSNAMLGEIFVVGQFGKETSLRG
ncbi:MAG: hypothetical protein WBD10_06375 [Acidobacteriaceae bacterium]